MSVIIIDITTDEVVNENITIKEAAKNFNTTPNYLSRMKQNDWVFQKKYKIFDVEKEKQPSKKETDLLEIRFINTCIWLRNRIGKERLSKIAIVPGKEPV